MEDEPVGGAEQDDERVPIFGSWRAIYSAVIVTILAVMGAIALFSSWRW